MAEITGLVLPFFGLIFLGYFVARINPQPDAALGWLNIFVIYVALPALFFQLISETPVDQLSNWSFIITATLATYLAFTLVFVPMVVLGRAKLSEAVIQGLAGAYGNIGYMGPGIALLAFGREAAVPVALIFCFETFLHFTLAPLMMGLEGNMKGSAQQIAVDVGKKIVLHPYILATLAGVAAAIFSLSPPQPVAILLDYLSGAAAPCALFAMGVTLASRPLRRVPPELGLIVPVKLLIHPMMAYLLLSWVGDFDPIWMSTAVLLAALPTAANVFVIAQQYGVWAERASASVLVTTMISVGSLSALLYLMKTGVLPPDLFPG